MGSSAVVRGAHSFTAKAVTQERKQEMIRTKLGLKVLGLCALVVGVMAIGTTGVAQAEVGACWGYINPTTLKLECFSKTLEAKPKFEIENNTGTLLIEKQIISILCTGMEFDEGGELSENGTILLNRIKFTGCVGLINGVISPPCKPNDPISGSGTVLTEKATGLIRLHELVGGEKEPTVLIKPDEGETLAKIHLGPECAVGEELIVKGELVLWDCKGKASFEEHKVTHLLEEFKALQLMHVGLNKATLDGSTNVTLKGTHEGFKWAGKAI
jgi:hypothetical protein